MKNKFILVLLIAVLSLHIFTCDAFENKKIKGYYDLQNAEVDGAYNNAIKHIEIFDCSDKAELFK